MRARRTYTERRAAIDGAFIVTVRTITVLLALVGVGALAGEFAPSPEAAANYTVYGAFVLLFALTVARAKDEFGRRD